MKKNIFTLILISIVLLTILYVIKIDAADWRDYESGRNSIRLDGYSGQSGYICFTNGDGTKRGYLWVTNDGNLRYATAGIVDQSDDSGRLDDTYYQGAILND